MGIKRYFASIDSTITDAFKGDGTRATGSNAGVADAAEVFFLYGSEYVSSSATSASLEKSRSLFKFPVSDISTDRDNGKIPASGSVSFYLRLFNADTNTTTPRSASYEVLAVKQPWAEGTGVDLDGHTDDDVCNWIAYNSSDAIQASSSITVHTGSGGQSADDDSEDGSGFSAGASLTISGSSAILLYATGAATQTTNIDQGGPIGPSAGFLTGTVGTQYTQDQIGDFIARTVGLLTGSNVTASYSATTNVVTVSGYNIDPSPDGNSFQISVSSSFSGSDDTAPLEVWSATGSGAGLDNDATGSFTGGQGREKQWETEGGTFFTGSSDAPIMYSVFMERGDDDVELDISELVEQWIADSKANNGVVFKLSGAYESATNGRSYYTKKVFTRRSEYFFKRPVVEARYDLSTQDDAARFYLSSSLVTAANNLNTLYLYNFFGGQLTNIPAVGTYGLLQLSLYSASQEGLVAGDKLYLPAGGNVATLGDVNVTGGYVSTGIYSASFAYASSSITKAVPVWTTTGSVVFQTGSTIDVKTYAASSYYNIPEYKLNIVNLQDLYYTDEEPTFRIFTQDKNRQVNIYTVATADPPVSVIPNLYYSIAREVDEKTIISYGTSSVEHTKLSYDNSGSFFSLDMSMFEPGYSYIMRFLRKFGTDYTQLPAKFRFRVQERND